MSEVARAGDGPQWPTYPSWKNGPWPNRRRPPVSDEDLVSAFGAPVKSIAEHEDVGWYEAHVVLESETIPPFRVFVQHHTVVDPAPGKETAEWWPEADRAEHVDGLGNEAYVTASGGVVCRSGARWTAGVLPLSGELALPIPACQALLNSVLSALSNQGVIRRLQTWNASRFNFSGYAAAEVYSLQRLREQRRAGLLSGVRPQDLDAWMEDWHARRRLRAAKRVLLVAPVLAVISALSNTDQWLENLVSTFVFWVVVALVVWLCMGLVPPKKYKKKLREQTWP